MNRNDYLGASEVGAIVAGRTEHDDTPVAIYLRKKGLKESYESEIMQRGLDLEYALYKKFIKTQPKQERNGWKYQPCKWEEPLINPKYPWLACHPDAINTSLKQVLEIKLISKEWPLDEDIIAWLKAFHPSKYWQFQSLLMITESEILKVYAQVNCHEKWRAQVFGEGKQYLEILPNKTDMQEIVEKTHAFYYDNLLANKIPEYTEEKPVELKTDFVETDAQLIQDIQDFAEMTVQERNLKASLDNLKDKLKGVYSKTTHKSILAGQILLRANMKSGASRLSKDRCIAQGLDLTGCYERGAPVYTLEVVRRKEEK